MTPEQQLDEARYVLELCKGFLEALDNEHWPFALEYRVGLVLRRIGGDADAEGTTLEPAVKTTAEQEARDRSGDLMRLFRRAMS